MAHRFIKDREILEGLVYRLVVPVLVRPCAEDPHARRCAWNNPVRDGFIIATSLAKNVPVFYFFEAINKLLNDSVFLHVLICVSLLVKLCSIVFLFVSKRV